MRPSLIYNQPCSLTVFGKDTKLIYRHYATLYFVVAVDNAESELGILDLIQVRALPAVQCSAVGWTATCGAVAASDRKRAQYNLSWFWGLALAISRSRTRDAPLRNPLRASLE